MVPQKCTWSIRGPGLHFLTTDMFMKLKHRKLNFIGGGPHFLGAGIKNYTVNYMEQHDIKSRSYR